MRYKHMKKMCDFFNNLKKSNYDKRHFFYLSDNNFET